MVYLTEQNEQGYTRVLCSHGALWLHLLKEHTLKPSLRDTPKACHLRAVALRVAVQWVGNQRRDASATLRPDRAGRLHDAHTKKAARGVRPFEMIFWKGMSTR